MLTTQRKLFIPNAVFIPTKDGKEGEISTEPIAVAYGRWRVLLRPSLHRGGVAERR